MDYEWVRLFYLVSNYIDNIIESDEAGFFTNELENISGIDLAIKLTDQLIEKNMDYNNEEEIYNYLDNINSGR